MFSIYNILLSHLLEQDDITCSIISAGREHLDLKNIVGYFINPILFKCHVDQKESFNDFLQRMSREILEAFKYQSYPLELVFEELKMKYPDISVAFNMLNIQDLTAEEELVNLESYHLESFRDVKFNLEIYAAEYKNGIEVSCFYKKSLFQPSTIEYIMDTYVKLMDNISAEQDT
jgi:fengycin family lipopeptide synthetase D